MKRILAALALVATVQGCITTAGPFITHMYPNGDGSITVEKCLAKFDPWASTISNADCVQQVVNLQPGK